MWREEKPTWIFMNVFYFKIEEWKMHIRRKKFSYLNWIEICKVHIYYSVFALCNITQQHLDLLMIVPPAVMLRLRTRSRANSNTKLGLPDK